jgi:hypothetical protein
MVVTGERRSTCMYKVNPEMIRVSKTQSVERFFFFRDTLYGRGKGVKKTKQNGQFEVSIMKSSNTGITLGGCEVPAQRH